MDCKDVMDKHSSANVHACSKCKCHVITIEEVTKTWNGMEQFISLFLVLYVSMASFITSYKL